MNIISRILPIFLVFTVISFVGVSVDTSVVEAKSKFGGKMYKSSPKKSAPTTTANNTTQKSGGFKKGLAGGLLGGALGAMLFGSMMGGTGIGILPILLLAGVGFFLFKRMGQGQRRAPGSQGGYGSAPQPPPFSTDFGDTAGQEGMSVRQGLAQIGEMDPGFDEKHFREVASDVFFQVQAGWMRRDIDSYRHLLGETLAGEYAQHFNEMREKGIINKVESIAVRGIEIVEAGSDGQEDFITILFTASLLDYTIKEDSGEVIEGSDTAPVKFREKWTWARPIRTEDWKLEGIHPE